MDKAGAFLAQAKSDFSVFERLWELNADDVPACHALHHLQMATEKLAKAVRIYLDPDTSRKDTHVAFREIVHILKRRDVIRKLGYADEPERFKYFIEGRRSWFLEVERLCPSVGTDVAGGRTNGPNVEYPWLGRDIAESETWIVPAEHTFPLAQDLRSSEGAYFIVLLRRLLDRIPEALT